MQRRVILKRLHDDCLLDGELHPSIRQRLERIQQLPMTEVANLHGLERREDGVFLVWEFVPGRPLAEMADRAAHEKEVRHVVESLHSHGIVHGAIHERNVIIDDLGGVHLTHLSPLLYGDPAIDLAAVDAIFSPRLPMQEQRPTDSEPDRFFRRSLVGASVAALIGLLITASLIYFASIIS